MRRPLAPPGDFVLPQGKIFLGAATMGTMLRSSTDAVLDYHLTARPLANDVTPVFTGKSTETRRAVARLFGGPESVFFSGNCTNAQALVATCLKLTADDIMVVAHTPYCGPWLASPAQVRIVAQTTEAYLEAIADLMRTPPTGRVIVSAEAVEFINGTKLDIPAMYQAVKALPDGVLAIDASQWWGAFEAPRFADVIFMTGNKWLHADHGVAVTWVNPELLPKLTPPFSGWKHGGRNRAEGLLAQLGMLEMGGKPWAPLWTLADSVKYLLGLGGLAALEAHIAPLVKLATDLLVEGGMPLISPTDPRLQSGNVCFELPDIPATEAFYDRLQVEEGVVLSFGGDVPRLRFTPGAYTSEDDIRLAAAGILRVWHRR